MPRVMVSSAAQVLAARERARLAARSALTCQLNGLAGDSYVAEACWSSPADALGEAAEVALTAVRLAATLLEVSPATLLGGLLVGRTAVELSEPPP